MKIGVTGPQGRLGSELVRQGCDPIECDITIPEEVKSVLSVGYDVVINAAAYTYVERAEDLKNQERVFLVNFRGPVNLYKYAGYAHLIQISTDYVFGGKRGPYTEKSKYSQNDLPVNYYGHSKFAAEAALLQNPMTTVVRTTGLFGVGNSLVSDILVAVKENSPIYLVDDLIANQTYVPWLAKDLVKLAQMGKELQHIPLIHLASYDTMSRFEFAKCVLRCFGLSEHMGLLHSTQIDKIGWIAKRPKHGGLSVGLAKSFGFITASHTISDGLTEYAKCL